MSAFYYQRQLDETALVIAHRYLNGEPMAMRDQIREVNQHTAEFPVGTRSEILLLTEWLRPDVSLVRTGRRTSDQPVYSLAKRYPKLRSLAKRIALSVPVVRRVYQQRQELAERCSELDGRLRQQEAEMFDLRLRLRDLPVPAERRTQSEGDSVTSDFISRCKSLQKPKVLELGTRRSVVGKSTMHRQWVPDAGQYLGTDIEAGVDVDVVADVHRLSEAVGIEQFDIVISCSTFEHLKYPHLAAHEVMKVLKIGGIVFIQTHQSFPIHSYPYDYFRFSREALAGLFGSKMGFRVIGTRYDFPAAIYSQEILDSWRLPAFLNSCMWGEKTAATPRTYVYDYDVP